MSDTTTIDIFPSSPIGAVPDRLFSGFLEHLGRCIYGGILPSTPITFPYTPRNPAPSSNSNGPGPSASNAFVETPKELVSPEGWRTDVMSVLRDELRMPMVRWPGGNYVSSYHWMDGVGPKSERRRRPELAWGGEESNLFGTDECVRLRHVLYVKRKPVLTR
jgi:alpha-N-arabinofuranosidase